MTEEIKYAVQVDDHLNVLTVYVINGQPSTRSYVKEEIKIIGHFKTTC